MIPETAFKPTGGALREKLNHQFIPSLGDVIVIMMPAGRDRDAQGIGNLGWGVRTQVMSYQPSRP